MNRLASTRVVSEAVSYAHSDLDRAVELWQFVAEQKLLGGLPTDLSPYEQDRLHQEAAHGDLERHDQRAQLLLLDALAKLRDHMAGVEEALKRVRAARIALGARLPAIDAALNAHEKAANRSPNLIGVGPDGRVGTSGVSLDEADRQRKGQVEAEPACAVCDAAVSAVGRLKSGFCPTDYQAWWRAGRPERQPWILQRRAELEAAQKEQIPTVARMTPIRAGIYREDLREVA